MALAAGVGARGHSIQVIAIFGRKPVQGPFLLGFPNQASPGRGLTVSLTL